MKETSIALVCFRCLVKVAFDIIWGSFLSYIFFLPLESSDTLIFLEARRWSLTLTFFQRVGKLSFRVISIVKMIANISEHSLICETLM